MPIAAVSIPVPPSGDGPAISVASLVEAKTVILSGRFRGSYTILANHVGGTFAPVLLFNSDGTEEIRQTLSGAFSEIRVRANAGVAQATPVTVIVSALQKAGANLFTTLATLAPGATGLSPVIDLAALFPPTGLEDDINIICSGGFAGTITLLGSNDGFSFNPIGTFQASPAQKDFFGQIPLLEFSPLSTSDLIRYLRLEVSGKISSTTTVTIGGAIFNTVVNNDTLSGAYNNGTLASDQTLSLTDAHGGGVVVLGSGLMFTGQNSFVIQAPLGGVVLFPRVGGFSVQSQLVDVAATILAWNEVDLKSSTLVLAGPPALIASLAMAHVGSGIINAVGSTVADAYDLRIDAAPAGLVTIARAWSLGTAGAVQVSAGGLVLGSALSPPGENDVVLGAGATSLSQVNSGRLGYELAGQRFMVSANGGAYVPLLTGPAGMFTQGSVPFAGVTGQLVEDNAAFFWDETGKRLGVNVAAAPTAQIHVAGSAAGAPGTGSLKLDPGVLLLAPESGAIESDGTHLYWTNGTNTRVELDNTAVATTLAQAYNNGTVAGDQEFIVLDAEGGGLVVNATTPGLFTGVTAFEIDVIGGNVNFYRVGGFDVQSTMSKAAAAGTVWDEVNFLASTLTLTGGPAVVTTAAQVRVGAAVVNGLGNSVSDAYDLFVEAGPGGTATITRAWSLGTAGAVQVGAGMVLGAGLLPPTENDLAVGVGATVVSQANSGRLGYLAGGMQKFMVSQNSAAYVPILTGPAAGGFTQGSVPFGSATGELVEDNAQLFWDDTNKYLGIGTNVIGARLVVAGGTYVDVAGVRNNVLVSGTFAPVGGTAAYDEVNLTYVVDQTGGANGRIVGLMIAATETAVGGLHYPIDVFAGVGGVTEIFRLVNDGAVQVKKGVTLGLGLATPGESDLAIENGATVVSQANTGRIGYRTSTQQFYVSMNGGAYVPIVTGTASVTLAQAYAFGAVAADQTLALLDTKGGGLVVDGTAVGFTGTNALAVNGAATGAVLFPRVGGMSVVSSVSVAAAPGSSWNEVDLQAATLTLTGGPATSTAVAMVHIGAGVVNGVGNTVADAYNAKIDAAPAGTATLTRPWSLGVVGAVQFAAGLVLGTGLAAPGENDLVVGAGATNVSTANSGRFGYLAGATQQFMVSMNTGAYVPLLVGPAASGFTQGSVPFAGATGQLTQDNTHFFWNATNVTLQLNGAAANTTSALAISTSKTLAAPVLGSIWDGLRFEDSTLTATMGAGNVTITELVSSHFHQPTITTGGGAGLLTVTDAYTVRVGAPPIGTGNATLTNAWSLGVTGAVKLMSLLLINPAAVSSGVFTGVTQIAAAHTNLTAGTEVPDTNFNLSATKTWATGAIATQRDFLVQARTYAFAAASTVTTAATVAITNAPQVGANAAITNAYALWTQAGATQLNGGSYVQTTGTKNQLGVTATFAPTSGTANFNALSIAYTINQTGGASGTTTGLLIAGDDGNRFGSHYLIQCLNGSPATNPVFSVTSTGILFLSDVGGLLNSLTIDTGISSSTVGFTSTVGFNFRVSGGTSALFLTQTTANTLMGLTTDVASSRLRVQASKTVVAATGAVWNGIEFVASTLTLTGATTPITTLNYFSVATPTITAGSAVVITDFFTCRISAATFTGGGPASATRNWSLGIDGNTKFGGGQTIHGTDVNVAGPYVILATDYYLHVRRTATAAISLNLPSIAVVGDGFVIMAKDSGYNAAINNITWVRNGADTIENVAGNYLQIVSGSLIIFVANATTNNWELS
jgi:hypothetical protein